MNRQIDECKYCRKGASKRFVEIIYSIEVVKIKVFFTSFNEWSQRRSAFEMEVPLLKIFSSILWSILKSVSLSFEKLDIEEGSEYLFQ